MLFAANIFLGIFYLSSLCWHITRYNKFKDWDNLVRIARDLLTVLIVTLTLIYAKF